MQCLRHPRRGQGGGLYERDPRASGLERDSRFHRYEMSFDDGKDGSKEEWASHTASLQWLGGVMHQEAREPRLIETRVRTEQQESGATLEPQVWHIPGYAVDPDDARVVHPRQEMVEAVPELVEQGDVLAVRQERGLIADRRCGVAVYPDPALTTDTPLRGSRRRPGLSSLGRTAFHEAGHAVAAVLQRKALRKVTIVPDKESGDLGCTFTERFGTLFHEAHVGRKQRGLLEREVMVLLAGPEAEALASGRRNHVGAFRDYQCSCDLLDYLCRDPRKLRPYVDLLFVRTEAMFVNEDPNWRAVEALVEALLREKTIGGRRAREIILKARRSSPAALTGIGQGQAALDTRACAAHLAALHGPD